MDAKLPVPPPRLGKSIEKYDPEVGLKTIAVAEAAEKHFARAKDAEQLFRAIEKKLLAQAEYVAWWDRQEKSKGGGDGSNQHKRATRNRSVTGSELKAGKNGVPERMVLSRWRKLIDKNKLETSLREAQNRCLRICEMDKGASELVQQSLSNEHYTPQKYIEAARKVLGVIDLDPASCKEANAVVKAAKFFDEEKDGLNKKWEGRVWMNPPYGRLVGDFVEKLSMEIASGNVSAAIVLVNAHCTDTSWFQFLWDGCLCFTDHRINFYGDDERSGSTHGSVFVYLGEEKKLFVDTFSQFGACVARIAA